MGADVMGSQLRDWLALAQVLALMGSVGINVWIFIAARSDSRWQAMHESMKHADSELDTRLEVIDRHLMDSKAQFDKRLSILETSVDGMPKHRDLLQIREQLARIDKSVGALDERSEATGAAVNRIEKYLLESRR